jgi:glycine hydroxymethyltransferase
MAERLISRGVRIVSGGTENHMFLADMRSIDEDLTGKEAATLLDSLGITLNRNAIPFDPRSPFITSGIRIGTPSVTTQGMEETDVEQVADLIARTLNERHDEIALKEIGHAVGEMASRFPPYGEGFVGHV